MKGEAIPMQTTSKKLAVFSIRNIQGGHIWVRAGSAFVNRDGSMNVHLDVLPLDGKLHVREPGERKDATVAPLPTSPRYPAAPAGEELMQAAGGQP
jgi:hypothetical protein